MGGGFGRRAEMDFAKQAMMINGHIGRIELRELPKDMAALIIMIHDPVPEVPVPTATLFTPQKLELGKSLSLLPGELMEAAEHLDRDTINTETYMRRYFQLKSTGSRVRALSNYLAGNGADD